MKYHSKCRPCAGGSIQIMYASVYGSLRGYKGYDEYNIDTTNKENSFRSVRKQEKTPEISLT